MTLLAYIDTMFVIYHVDCRMNDSIGLHWHYVCYLSCRLQNEWLYWLTLTLCLLFIMQTAEWMTLLAYIDTMFVIYHVDCRMNDSTGLHWHYVCYLLCRLQNEWLYWLTLTLCLLFIMQTAEWMTMLAYIDTMFVIYHVDCRMNDSIGLHWHYVCYLSCRLQNEWLYWLTLTLCLLFIMQTAEWMTLLAYINTMFVIYHVDCRMNDSTWLTLTLCLLFIMQTAEWMTLLAYIATMFVIYHADCRMNDSTGLHWHYVCYLSCRLQNKWHYLLTLTLCLLFIKQTAEWMTNGSHWHCVCYLPCRLQNKWLLAYIDTMFILYHADWRMNDTIGLHWHYVCYLSCRLHTEWHYWQWDKNATICNHMSCLLPSEENILTHT